MIKNFLGQLPKLTEQNEFADFVELYCLRKSDACVTYGDLADLIFDNGSDEEEEESDDDSEKNDKKSQKLRDAIDFLFTRENQYYDFYPFEIDKQRRILKLKKNITRRNRFYIVLLLASNLRFFSKSEIALVTHTFEKTSFLIFQKIFPKKNIKSFLFGAGGNSPFRGNLFSKITELARLLGQPLNPLCSPEEIGKNNVGDGGLDIVGWFDFDDTANGKPLIFAQCACGVEWEFKQIESHSIRWGNFVLFTNKPINILFIPRHYRKYDGNWYKATAIYDTVLIDRKRFIDIARSIPMPRLIKPYKTVLNNFFNLPKIDEFD